MSDARSFLERGNALYMGGRYAEAAECYREAIRLQPLHVDAINNLGASLAELGRLDDAIACYREAIRLLPTFASAYYNLGNALRAADRLDEAIAAYAQSLRLQPDSFQAHTNLGLALFRSRRFTEAMASYRRALEIKPGYPTALVNLGLALAETGRLAEALACYDETLRQEPDYADAHRNRSLARLLAGDWSRGLPEYQWRWRCADFTIPKIDHPPWDGSPLDGRKILLYTEQGLGDALQFVRYTRLVKERGGFVVLAAQERLHPILSTVATIDRLEARERPVPPDFDVHYALMDLPALFGTTPDHVPSNVPYLHAEPARVERWRRALEPVAGFRVGIAWRGNAATPHDYRRSISLAEFAPLARIEGVRLVSLQVGRGSEEIEAVRDRFAVVDLSDRLDASAGAFLDIAAIMANLDLVVTCDTSIAHLAGALARPTWIALPTVPDWRWLLDREDTPWYPTARLFRQWVAGRWNEPFERMAEALRTRVAESTQSSHSSQTLHT